MVDHSEDEEFENEDEEREERIQNEIIDVLAEARLLKPDPKIIKNGLVIE